MRPISGKANLEVKTEDGAVERTFAQCAQTWPLADRVKLNNIEAAIQTLRQTCDYLYHGLSQVGSVAEQKIDTVKVQGGVQEIAGQIQKRQACLDKSSSKNEALSSGIDDMTERINAAHCRIENVGGQTGAGSTAATNLFQGCAGIHQSVPTGHQKPDTMHCRTPSGSPIRDQKITDMEEAIFRNGVTVERGLQECREGLANAQLPVKGQISESAYQEHAKGTERALEDLRSQEVP